MLATLVSLLVLGEAPLARVVLKAGDKAPEIGVMDTKGVSWKLNSLKKDTVYLVEFWATWCTTCKKIAPTVEAFVKTNRGEKFEFLAVSVDDDLAELRKELRAKKPEWPILMDPDFSMMNRWGVVGVPRLFFVRNGVILWEREGEVSAEDLRAAWSKISS
jgi:thiol-disulfide isomerase/thioredoxin